MNGINSKVIQTRIKKEKELLHYYEKNIKKLFNAVENPNWRIWKKITPDGICRQNKYQISSPEKLLKFIVDGGLPDSLYVSISSFLNPHKNHGNFANQKATQKDGNYFYPRAGYLTADNMLIDSYFFVDLDYEKDLTVAQKDGRAIIKALKIKPYSIQFSGKKGIHIIYKLRHKPIEDIKARIKFYQDKKEEMIKIISQLKLKTIDNTHLNIMKDMYRVYAVPYSKKKTGAIVTPITYNDFMKKNIHTILSKRKIFEGHKAIEAKANDKKVASDEGNLHPNRIQNHEGDSLTSDSIFFSFVDNMVNGLKDNYVTVIKKHRERFKVETLQYLQETYNLSDFYIFILGDYVYAVNTKLQQFKRLVKILRAAKSENLSFFMTRRHCPIPISNEFDASGEVHNKINVLSTLKSEYGRDDWHSSFHSKFFNLEYQKMAGNINNIGTMVIS